MLTKWCSTTRSTTVSAEPTCYRIASCSKKSRVLRSPLFFILLTRTTTLTLTKTNNHSNNLCIPTLMRMKEVPTSTNFKVTISSRSKGGSSAMLMSRTRLFRETRTTTTPSTKSTSKARQSRTKSTPAIRLASRPREDSRRLTLRETLRRWHKTKSVQSIRDNE